MSQSPNNNQPRKKEYHYFWPKKSDEKNKKSPVIIIGSSKGGSGKTYCAIAIATALAIEFDNSTTVDKSERKSNVCLLDLDLIGTNMHDLFSLVKGKSDFTFSEPTFFIHEYIQQSTERSVPYEKVIAKCLFKRNLGDSDALQFDVIIGSPKPYHRKLFQRTADHRFRDRIRINEARPFLIELLDSIVKMKYDAIVVDMQPGMEGLAETVLNYFNGQSNHGKGTDDVYKEYQPHLCLANTSDTTHIQANARWWIENCLTYPKIKKIHFLIKDTLSRQRGHFLDAKELYDNHWIHEIMIEAGADLLPVSENGLVKNKIASLCVLQHNKSYCNIYMSPNDPAHHALTDAEATYPPFRSLFDVQAENGNHQEIKKWLEAFILKGTK